MTAVPFARDPNDWLKNIMMPLGVASMQKPATPQQRKWHMCFAGRFPGASKLVDRDAKWHGATYMITNGSWVKRYRTDLRAIMIEATRNNPDRYRFNDKKRDRLEYVAWLHECTFCYAPHGDGPATVRVYESINAGCIPVMWAYGNSLPFQRLISYHDFAIAVPYNESITAAGRERRSPSSSEAAASRSRTTSSSSNH